MDRAEEILSALETILANAGYSVERDRRFPVGPGDPVLAILYTGDEENRPHENAPAHDWASRWVMRPFAEIWLRNNDPAALSSAGRSAWNAVRNAAVAYSPLLDLLAYNEAPSLSVSFEEPEEAADMLVVRIEFELAFDR